MKRLAMTPERAEAWRLAAEELLAEANIRGDLDEATVSWAVTHLLNSALSRPRVDPTVRGGIT